MNTFINPDRTLWPQLCERPQVELDFLEGTVKNILNRVKTSGDAALFELTKQFDKVTLENLLVSDTEIQESKNKINSQLKDSIRQASENIRNFHTAQRRSEQKIETSPGVTCWRKYTPIESVGIYIPGGTAPLFSTVLMLAIPAAIAGCENVILCTPPNEQGEINPAILYAAHETGVQKIFKVGGAQAIAAMAFGTETIPVVQKIFGPGNQFVTKAKQLVSEQGTAIDMPAGPSEVMVIADENSTPEFVAADLLSQAEHGEDSQVILLTNKLNLVKPIVEELNKQLKQLPRKSIAEKSLQHARFITFENKSELFDFVNSYAPEHLIINTENAFDELKFVKNAGSIFLGNFSAEAIGDYASGTNHTLPTNGNAKAFSGVSLESFQKAITVQAVTAQGIQSIGKTVECMAEAESLAGHKEAVRLRRISIEKS